MKYKNFLAVGFRLPFRKKRFICIISTYLLAVFCALPSAANDDVRRIEPADSKQSIKQAQKLTRKGKLKEAEEVLRDAVERSPKDSKVKLALAYVLLKQRRLVEAYDFSFEVARSEPKNSYAFAILGATLLNAGNFRDAETSFVNAINLNNQEGLAWLGLGMLNFYENQISLGLDYLREAVYLEPEEPDFWYALAQVSARDERYKDAAQAYQKFLQISPYTDTERRDRIKGLINFLRFLGNQRSLYETDGAKQTVVSFKLLNDRPIIQIRLRKTDEPLNFVLDTGSGISVISEETAQKMKINPITRGGLARGIGGDGKFEIVYGFLPSIFIGDVKIKNVPIYIRKFHAQNERIDGYIGLSLISKFLTTIDYGDLTFTLVKKGSNKSEPIDAKNLSLPLRLTSSGFLSGEVSLEGIEVPLNFIVDTGASVSVISDIIAGSKNISPFIKAETMRVVGAAGVTENVPSFTLPRVTFGSHSRQSVTAIALDLGLINETSGFEQAGILGGNFLKNYRLTFDFQNSKVVFVPIK
jgi:Flp pilus assembly protein TadD/predicted aspartyl protease